MKKLFLRVLVFLLVFLLGYGISYATLSDGLVAYYSFNGHADDESGYGNNGVIHIDGDGAKADFTEGRFGTGLDFSGSYDSYVEVPHSDSLTPSQAVTISLWAKVYSYPKWHTSLVYKAGEEPTNNGFKDRCYTLWATAGGGVHFTATPEGADSQIHYSTAGGLYPLNEFVHFVGVVNTQNHTMSIYINGNLVQTSDYSGDSIRGGNYPLRIGAPFLTLSDQAAFDGVIDEVRIYNRALSDSEIKELYGEDVTQTDTTKPIVKSMSATPSTVDFGQQVTISYTVTDNVALKQVELWIMESGSSKWNPSGKVNDAYSTRSSGSFKHTASKAGTINYGIHVVDEAGNWDSEGSAGPKPVKVITPVLPTLSTDLAVGTTYGSKCTEGPNVCNNDWKVYLLVRYEASLSNQIVDPGYKDITIKGNNLDKVTAVVSTGPPQYRVELVKQTRTELTLKVSAVTYDAKPSSVTITLNGNSSLTKKIKVIPGFNNDQLYGQCSWYAWHIARLKHKPEQKTIKSYGEGMKMQADVKNVLLPKEGSIIMSSNCVGPKCGIRHTAYVKRVEETSETSKTTKVKTVTYKLIGEHANFGERGIGESACIETFAILMKVTISADGKTSTMIKPYPKLGLLMTYIYY